MIVNGEVGGVLVFSVIIGGDVFDIDMSLIGDKGIIMIYMGMGFGLEIISMNVVNVNDVIEVNYNGMSDVILVIFGVGVDGIDVIYLGIVVGI